MMMTPIPLMNPDSTGYGIYLTYFPMRINPKRIWNNPQNIPAIAIDMSTVEKLPLLAVHAALIRDAVMTVIGPVGPEICECVPPNKAAKKPSNVAPIKPANAPKEGAAGSLMPPKA